MTEPSESRGNPMHTTHCSPTLRLLLVALLLMSASLAAQTAATGAIAGTVTDPKGAVISDATINAIDETTGEKRTTVSSSTGTYIVPLLHPATYRVEITKRGFKLSVSSGIPVHITETVSVNVRLEVGVIAETITVASNSQLLKTEESTLGNVIDEKEVNALPLVTRHYTQIIGLSPGVSAEVFNAGEIGRGGVDDAMVTNGGSYLDNNFQMNGVEINDWQGSGHFSGGTATPNPDSIQEFKVQTSQYDASYGRDAGANVDVLTKAGSNSFHGNLWEYFRNEDLNANDYFLKENGQPRPPLKQNQFGFTLGGPIKKDKLLFFTSYQGTRQRNGYDADAACLQTILSPPLTNDRSRAGLGAVFNGQPGALGGMVAPNGSNIDPVALAIMGVTLPNGSFLIPTPQTINPNLPFPIQGLTSLVQACAYNEDQFVTNADFLHTSKSRLTGRFFFS